MPVNRQKFGQIGVEFGREQALHLQRYAFIPITIVQNPDDWPTSPYDVIQAYGCVICHPMWI